MTDALTIDDALASKADIAAAHYGKSRRDLMAWLRSPLSYAPEEIGSLPDLSGRTVLVIGGSEPRGLGYNIGRLAALKGAQVTLTTRSQQNKIDKMILRGGFTAEGGHVDVTDEKSLSSFAAGYAAAHEALDLLLLTPAYLDPHYLSLSISWDDVPEDVQEEGYRSTVAPLRRVMELFGNPLASARGTLAVATFPLTNLPGYTIGPLKERLVRAAKTAGERGDAGFLVSVLSLPLFPSVSSLPIAESLDFYEEAERLLCYERPASQELFTDALRELFSGSRAIGYRFHDISGLAGLAGSHADELDSLFTRYRN